MKRSVDDIDVRGRRVLLRLDLNVPLDGRGGISDDRRIVAALPTIRRLIEGAALQGGGGRLVVMSHLGRPKSEADRKTLSLAPIGCRLGELLGVPVRTLGACVGESVRAAVNDMSDGQVVLLENLRFHQAETIKDKAAAGDSALRAAKDSFARQLADLGDVYVNDAFGTCHRDNASMLTVPAMMAGKPRVVGYLVQRELDYLGRALAEPVRPFVCVLGGAKVSDKLGAIESLLDRCDRILIGGAMAYTFLLADGVEVGNSLVEPDMVETARRIRAAAGDRLVIPVDSVCARGIKDGAEATVHRGAVPEGLMGLDIGPASCARFAECVAGARTILWNGPMGVFESPPFDKGTLAMATAIAEATDRGAASIVGGGDSAAAVGRAGVSERMSHISTGGGAALEFLEGKRFAAIDVLDDR